MQTFILDAGKINGRADPADFLADFYHLERMSLFDLRKFLYSSDEIRVTEVFNWPVETPNWKAIADALENIQQHSPTFYVIWGPETDDALVYEEKLQGLDSQQTGQGVPQMEICTDAQGDLKEAVQKPAVPAAEAVKKNAASETPLNLKK